MAWKVIFAQWRSGATCFGEQGSLGMFLLGKIYECAHCPLGTNYRGSERGERSDRFFRVPIFSKKHLSSIHTLDMKT